MKAVTLKLEGALYKKKSDVEKGMLSDALSAHPKV